MIGQEEFLNECMEIMPIIYRLNRSFNQSADLHAFQSLPPAQLHALIMLWNSGTMNMTQLADQMLMTRQQLTRVVDALVDKGLVERGADPGNRRHVLISLTQQGNWHIQQKLFCEPNGMTRFLELLDGEDAQRLLDAIRVVKDVLLKASVNSQAVEAVNHAIKDGAC